MDNLSLQYIDALFKEYLLFRGFSDTLQAFSAELKSDKIHGFQVERICALLFRRIVPSLHCTALMDLLQELDQHVYCRLDRQSEEAVGRMEVAILRYFIVAALKARKPDRVVELFELYGELLLAGKEGGQWQPWFTLPYVTKPEADPRFQAYFTPQWAALVETSFRNFLAQAFQQLPLPAVLRFDADRAKRADLQRQLDTLKRENLELRSRLGLAAASPAAALNPTAPYAAAAAAAAAPGSAAVAASPAAGTAAAAVAAALATDLTGSSRPGTPLSSASPGAAALLPTPPPSPYQQPAAAAQQQQHYHVQQQQLRRPPGAQPQPAQPQLQLYGRASGDGQELLLSHSSTVSLASQDTWGPEGLAAAASAASAGGPCTAGAGQAPVAGGRSQRGGAEGRAAGPAHGRTASLAEWCTGGGSSSNEGAAAVLEDRGSSGPGGAATHEGEALLDRSWGVGAGRGEPAAQQRGVLVQREVLSGGHSAPITCCAFGAQGSHIASGSADGTVRIWAPSSLAGAGGGGGSERAGSFSCGGAVTRLAWDRRGDKLLLVGTRGRGIKAWHLDTQRLALQVDAESEAPLVTALACSPSDATFACATSDYGRASGRLTLWNMRSFKRAHTFAMPSGAAVTSACFSRDGHHLAAAGIDGKVRLFDPSSRNQVMAWPVTDPGTPFAACFLGSSGLLATHSADGYIKLWSTAVVRGPLAGLHLPQISSMAEGRGLPGDAAAAGAGGVVQSGLAPAGSGSLVGRRGSGMRGAAGAAGVLQWQPDLACSQLAREAGALVFAAASPTAEMPLVFVLNGEELRLETGLPGHTGAVPALDWHPDGSPVLLTGSADHTLILSTVRQRDVSVS